MSLGSGESPASRERATTSTNYTLNSFVLNPGSTFYWQVHARSPNYFGTWSSAASFSTVSAITWTGAVGDGNWHNITNWNPRLVPNSYDYIIINSGTVYVPANFVFQNLTFNGGTLQNSFSVNGAMNWTGGTLGNVGALTISSGSLLNITGSATKRLARSINNSGTTLFRGAGYLEADSTAAVINNLAGGVFNQQTDAGINPSSLDSVFTFNNAGTFVKSGGTGSAAYYKVAFNNSGVMRVQSGQIRFTTGNYFQAAGTTFLDGGSLSSSTPINIQGGTLTGIGTVFGSVNNNGVIAPGSSPGSLAIANNLTSGSNSTLSIQLGGYTQGLTYDFLSAGTAALGGTLNVSFIDGFQHLVTNLATFTICTASPMSGLFNDVASGGLLTSSDGFADFIVSYSPNELVLTLVSVNVPKVTSAQKVGDDFVISFYSALNKNYRLERKDDLRDAAWTLVRDLVGTGSIIQAADFGGATQPMRFYRIRLLP